MGYSLRTGSIHTLDDDSLLHLFYICRLSFRHEDGDIIDAVWRYNENWWYAFAHVCRRWRNIILGSATYLGLSLLCTYGAPVAEMLAHPHPLPLTVSYFRVDRELTSEDEEGIILALKQHSRVRRIRLYKTMQRLIMALDEEYPILEYLDIVLPLEDNGTILRIPGTLQAPHLRYLTLQGFALPIGSRLLTTAVSLVTLHLVMAHPSTYFHPNTLIQWISLMPHLETLIIHFEFSIPSRDVERQLTHAPIIAPVTLPNLHHFSFHGVRAYLEALVHRIIAPRLEKLQIDFFKHVTFSVPRLLQFMNTAESFSFNRARFNFFAKLVSVGAYPSGESDLPFLSIIVNCLHLDWQVSSMAQISSSLSQIFSTVEDLALRHEVHGLSSEEHNQVDRAEWRKFFRSFSNVKTLRIEKGLIEDLSRFLELEDRELPFELLPELQEILLYFGSSGISDAFTSFVTARRNAGRPVTLIRW